VKYFAVTASFSSQTTQLVRLPDIPGQVVQVHLVHWAISSFSAVTGIALTLDHNVNLNITLSTNSDSKSQWWAGDQAHSGGGSAPITIPYRPPYELVGAQRFDHISSAGTVVGKLIILYTMRLERNRTVWNELRARTSFERD